MPSLLDAVEGTNENIDELKKAAGYQQDKADARIEPRPVSNISGLPLSTPQPQAPQAPQALFSHLHPIMKVPRRRIQSPIFRRCFSVSLQRREVNEIEALPERIHPSYKETPNNDLLSLRWPSPPRNILLVKKNHSPVATDAIIEFARHVHSTYPNIALILEPHTAAEVHSSFPFPIYTHPQTRDAAYPILNRKVDMTSTFGGDGTILHASSLFATTTHVPPILSFSMGTLGFLGEWKFTEYKRAFREVYMSGAGVGNRGNTLDENPTASSPLNENAEAPVTGLTGWSSIRGKSLGSTRGARVLLRNRLKVSIHSATGSPISRDNTPTSNPPTATHALNEVIIHRGADPHLAIVEVSVGGRFLTEAVADGMIVSTPTGSTAYSLSSGGSIIHPLVPSLLLTPICPRSLSFRPLVLPANAPVTLRLSQKNRGREVEVSVDGVRRRRGVGVGMEVRVWGEEVGRGEGGGWGGGVPCVMRGGVGGEASGDDGWVVGLNGLLKFNHPFGEEG